MDDKIIMMGLLSIITSLLLIDFIKAWRQHRMIYQNGTRYTGKIIGYQYAQFSVFNEGSFYPETPIVEFIYNNSKCSCQLMKNYSGQPNKIYADIYVRYWEKLPDQLIADDPYYWVRYLFDVLFMSIGILGTLYIFLFLL